MKQGLVTADLGKYDRELAELQAELDAGQADVKAADARKREKDDALAAAIKSATPEADPKNIEDAKWDYNAAIEAVNEALKKANEIEKQMSAVKDQRDAAAASGRKWIVGPGDSLSAISKAVYGDARKYMKIYDANRDKIKDLNIILNGWELTIPDL